MDPVALTAGRLHLRPWEPWDAADVLEACQDPAVQRWTQVPVPYTEADARAYVAQVSPQGWASGTGARFAVLDATTARVLASVALEDVADGAAELGFWTAAGARGRGVTAQAVATVCRWGFGALGLERVLWRAEVGNAGSRAVAESCGFVVEGTQRRGMLVRGARVDCWSGALLADDEVRDRRAFGSWRDRAGDGLVLRRWRDDDADAAALVEGCADPETARWVPVAVPYTLDTARWCLREQYPRQWAEGTVAPLAVEEQGRVVGFACLIAGSARSAPEVGWWTSPAVRGRGVARRAAALVADWAATLGHLRVEARVDVRNTASQRAAERAGYVREGVLRGAGQDRDGQPRDLVLYGRLAGAVR